MSSTPTLWFRLILAAAFMVVAPVLLKSQDGPGRGVPKLSTSLELISNPAVAKDLALNPEQLAELQRLLVVRKASYDEFIESVRPGSTLTDAQKAVRREQLTARLQEIEVEVGKSLLPHQLERFHQLVFQYQTKSQAASGGVLHARVANALKLTDAQESRIRDLAANHKQALEKRLEEMRAELAELQRKQAAEILDQLTPEQRREYDKLVGAPFQFESTLKPPK